jgi:hypothetical protein
VTASGDNTARLWDIDTGTEVVQFEGHTGIVWSAAFSADGTHRLITDGSENNVALVEHGASQLVPYVLSGNYLARLNLQTAEIFDAKPIIGLADIVEIYDLTYHPGQKRFYAFGLSSLNAPAPGTRAYLVEIDRDAAAVERARDFGGQRTLPVTSFKLIDGRGQRPVGVEHAVDAPG